MRRTIVFLLMISLSLVLRAQYFNSRYTLGFSATYFNSIIKTDSGIYACGGIKPPDSIYLSKMVFAQFDLTGNLIRNKYFELAPYSAYQPGTHTCVPHGNSINLCGGVEPDAQPTTAYSADVSIDTLGISISQYHDSTMQEFYLQSFVTLSSGNRIYLGGYQNAQAVVSYFIIKTDSARNELWRQYYPVVTDWQQPSVIISLQNGNLLIGSNGSPSSGSVIYSYTQLTEIDTAGNVIRHWDDTDSGKNTYAPCGIAELPNSDRIYATTYLTGQNQSEAIVKGYLARVDTAGHKVWQIKTGVGTPLTNLNQMKQLSDGNFLAVGAAYDSLATTDMSLVQSGWLIKFTAQGQILWEKRYYGVKSLWEENILYDFVEMDNGDIIACGQSTDHTAPLNDQQGWLLHLNSDGCLNAACNTGINDVPSDQAMKLYPNPAADKATLEYSIDKAAEVQLYDMTGRIVWSKRVVQGAGSITIDLSSVSAGLYMIRMMSDEKILFNTKLIVAK